MYAKLAFRNIRRSLRDYIIYFVTLTLTAALMYSFLALGLSPDILAMTENMSMLTTGILILSALIAFMSSFVIGYAVRFMLGQRKKEFAAYELMKKQPDCRIAVFEAGYPLESVGRGHHQTRHPTAGQTSLRAANIDHPPAARTVAGLLRPSA